MSTTYGSLFAGAGGADLGYDAAGWHCQWQVENDHRATMVLAHWWPTTQRHDDITTATATNPLLLVPKGSPASPRHSPTPTDFPSSSMLDPVDIVTGGFPCQDLSVSGRREGMRPGTRSGLFYEFVRLVTEMRTATDGVYPRWVIWENVPGLLSLGDTLGAIYAAWDQAGAVVQEHRLIDTGQAFGLPQRRPRVIGVVGFHPRADTAPPILADSPSLPRRTEPSGQKLNEGAPGVEGSTRSRGHIEEAIRRLTPLECERLMGYPDGHTAPAEQDTARYRLCGNGMVPASAEWVANRINMADHHLTAKPL